MNMKRFLVGAAFALAPVAGTAAPVHAPVPTENYITYMGSDWAWASPCSATEPSCSSIDWSYQSTQGWRLPTAAEIATYIGANLSSFVAAFGTEEDFKCAAGWFDNRLSHCDYQDAPLGYVWGLGESSDSYDETFAIRTVEVVAPVPVPAAGLMLVSAIAGIAGLRRRNRR